MLEFLGECPNVDLLFSFYDDKEDLEDSQRDRAKCGVPQIVSVILPEQRLVSVAPGSVSSKIRTKDIPGNGVRTWQYEDNQITNDVEDFMWELWEQAPQVWG